MAFSKGSAVSLGQALGLITLRRWRSASTRWGLRTDNVEMPVSTVTSLPAQSARQQTHRQKAQAALSGQPCFLPDIVGDVRIAYDCSMNCVALTGYYDVIVRRERIEQLGTSIEQLNEIMEVNGPFSHNSRLVVYGPIFGVEAADEFIRRMVNIGFCYWEDVMVIDFPLPSWLEFKLRTPEE